MTVTDTVTVKRPMNAHDAMTVETVAARATRQVVDVDSRTLRRVLERLPPGTEVDLEMEPLPARGNCWRVIRLASEPPADLAEGGPDLRADESGEGEATPESGSEARAAESADGVERACDRLIH